MERNTGAFADQAAARLMDHFGMKRTELPDALRGLEETAAYLNERTNLILCPVTLEDGWYRDSAGPVLARTEEGTVHAILPDRLGRYYFVDEGSRRRVYLSPRNAGRFRPEAYSAARALPDGKAPFRDFVRGLLRGFGGYEWAVLLLWSVLGGCLTALAAAMVEHMAADAVMSADSGGLRSMAAALFGTAALGVLMIYSGGKILRRGSRKAALAVIPGVGERIYFAGKPTDARGDLASLRDDAETLAGRIAGTVCTVLLLMTELPFLAAQSGRIAASAAVTASALLALASALAVRSGGRAGGRGEEVRRWLADQGANRRFGIESRFPGPEPGHGMGGAAAFALPASLPLLLPPVYLALDGGASVPRFTRLLLLCLPAVLLPMRALLTAGETGSAAARIRGLLTRAEPVSGGEPELPEPGSALELKDVSFSYKDRSERVLRDVSLRADPGEVLGILGGTGAGKTTLAMLMSGILTPDSGSVYYGGVELDRYNARAILRRIAWGGGEDICLTDRVPPERDGRTWVVFASREEELAGCDRVLRLSGGRDEGPPDRQNTGGAKCRRS